MTVDDYLAWERAQVDKHEYFRGEVFAMPGRGVRHNTLSGRVLRVLGEALEQRGCLVLPSDQRVLGAEEHYVYPDVTVICGQAETLPDDPHAVVNPTVIVEVLSDSTEAHDRGAKAASYRCIPSLREYVLVGQREPRIEVFRRTETGTWELVEARRGMQVALGSLGVTLDVDAIYRDPLG